MQIEIQTKDSVTVVTIEGSIDGKTAPEAQAKITPLLQPNSRVILDMSKVDYMSSAGLRTLLLVYRQSTGQSAKIVLVGISEEVKDVMTMTGFVKFFTLCDTLDAGLAAVNA
jgi:anti-sigma B factor antagonist